MEFKLGSVMLLLSCSLQQSLWGILASVPQTNANKCKNKISSEGAPTKRVQMIRRIPARCSGWDEAWSWISNKDCRTKYILDYVELPSAVQKVDQEDCEEEMATKTETGQFNLADEYLAIALGSAAVALLILIVIIVISVVRRGSNRCRICSSGPAYTSANASEREHLDGSNTAGNEYVDDELKLAEPMYEEIHDRTTAKKKLEFNDDIQPTRYQNLPEDEGEKNSTKILPPNGAQRRPVTPSAPYEEELQQTTRKCVPNDYSIFGDNQKLQKSEITDQVGEKSDTFKTNENPTDNTDGECRKVAENESQELEQKNNIEVVNNTGLPSDMSKTNVDSEDGVAAEMKDKISQKSSHSYENLYQTPPLDYESLATSDFRASSPLLQEQTSDQCLNTSTPLTDGDKMSLKCVNIDDASMPVKLGSSPTNEDCHVNTIYMQTTESSDNVTDSANLENEDNIADTCT